MAAQETNKLKGKIKALELQKELAEDKIKTARNALYGIGFLTIVLSVFNLLKGGSINLITGGIMLSIGAITVFLGYWSNKQAIAATSFAAVLITLLYSAEIYVIITRYGFAIWPIAFRVAICLVIYLGLYNAFVCEKIMKRYYQKKDELDELQSTSKPSME